MRAMRRASQVPDERCPFVVERVFLKRQTKRNVPSAEHCTERKGKLHCAKFVLVAVAVPQQTTS